MSHEATNWAIKQRGLKPATKIVLWYLCDRYHPDHGCFPSQETLAEDCEMSVRSVYTHITELQEKGLLKVVVRDVKKASGRFKSNFYILGCDPTFAQYSVPPSAKSSGGKNERPPSANLRSHRRQNLPTNSVREPVKEPSTLTRLNGGDLVSEISSSLNLEDLDCSNAAVFHDDVEAVLVSMGLDVVREFEVEDRGDGRKGRVDLVVMDQGQPLIGIECDRAEPRNKSIRKLSEFRHGIVALRESEGPDELRGSVAVCRCGTAGNDVPQYGTSFTEEEFMAKVRSQADEL